MNVNIYLPRNPNQSQEPTLSKVESEYDYGDDDYDYGEDDENDLPGQILEDLPLVRNQSSVVRQDKEDR